MKLLLAIPCYNCAPQIPRVLKALDPEIKKLVDGICIIDNQSKDNTLEVIKSVQGILGLKLIQNLKNYGLGGSFKQMVTYAKENSFDYMIWLHGDDQAEVEDLKKMIPLLNRERPDVIFGARFMRGSKLLGYNKVREWGNRFLNVIFSIVLGRKIYDLGSGLNIYKIDSLPLESIKKWPDHIAFDVNLLFHFCKTPYETKFFPISWKEKDQISNANNFKVAFKALKMLFHFSLFKRPTLEGIKEFRGYKKIIY